jgi:hypothetical protein
VELGAACVCEERQPEVEFTVSTTGGGNGGSVCGKARGGEVSSFIGTRALWRGSRESSHIRLRHGQGGGVAGNSRPGAARRAYGSVGVGWPAQDGFGRPVSMRHVARTDWVRTSVRKPWDRWSQRCSGSRVRLAGGATRRGHANDVARGCEPARFQFRVALFQHNSLQFFQLKWAE